MKVGDMIKVVRRSGIEHAGLLIRIGERHNGRRVGTVLTARGIETWPLDSHYEYDVVHFGAVTL